jgi:FlaA1/EpsC-like NDP-sugar epimerase
MLPLFRRQVASRASVTVTDSRMTRYVMTIAETVALAVVAGGLAARGDVFRLDMGRPVSVVDAARAVVADAGQEARGAIEIVGSRPGEKLHERLEAPGEPVWETDQDRVVRSGPRHADPLWLDGELLRLRMLVDAADADGVRVQLERLVERIQVDGTPVHPVGLG